MMKYGLILGVVGTFVCVTAVTPLLPSSPCPKEVALEEVCGTDEMTYNNCLIEVHTGDVKDTLSQSGSCNSEAVQQKKTKSLVKNVTESVVKVIEAVEKLKGSMHSKDESKTAEYLSDVNDVETLQKAHDDAKENIVTYNSEDSSKIDDTSDARPIVNKTVAKALDDVIHPNTIKLPIVEKSATAETKAKNISSTYNASNVDNDQKLKNKENKVKSVDKNITNNNEKSEDVKKPESSRKRRDVKNVADANGNDKGDTNNDSEKSKKLKRNKENSQTSNEGKIKQESESSKNKLENSRKRHALQNSAEVKETSKNDQAETKYKRDTKNAKNKQSKSDKQKNQDKSHYSRKQRDMKEKYGKKENFQKTQHSKRTDRKMK